jgi:hypothetical protein
MPNWTFERQYLIPIYQHLVIEAETLDDACRIALGNHPTIAEPFWDGAKEDFDSARPTAVTMIVPGAHDNPHDGGVLPVPIPDFASGRGDELSIAIAALELVVKNAPDDEPDAEDYDDTGGAANRGTEVGWWEAAEIARRALAAIGNATLPAAGTRIGLKRDVERFPYFTAPAGATGTVAEATPDLIRVKLDEPLAGAAEWSNCVHWERTAATTEDFRADVEIIERPLDPFKTSLPVMLTVSEMQEILLKSNNARLEAKLNAAMPAQYRGDQNGAAHPDGGQA